MTKRTILHLIHTDGAGGAETVVKQLVENLNPAAWRSVVATPEGSWLWSTLQGSGTELRSIEHTGAFDVGFISRLSRLLYQTDVDVIHTHLLGPAVYGTLAARIVGQPLVATMHGSVDLSVAEKWWGLKARVLSRRRNRFVAVTESLRAEMAETLSLPPARIRVIANGVDPAQFYPARDYALRGQFGWGEGEIVVGSVGNVRRPKGYHDLLEAAALVRDKSPSCRFVIVGDTSGEPELYRTLLEHREALGLDEFVAFVGFRDDISRCLNSLDIYVMSSVKEGLPLAILQAMASRLPIVATRCGGPQEILTHNQDALLVSPSDPQALAHGILQLADCTGLRRRLATAAHDLVTSRYTLDQTANEYQEVYSECLSTKT